MKYAIALILSLLATSAYAQSWQCFSGSVACAPGSPNCTCQQVQQPPVQAAPPQCPVMTFWNGVTCQVPAAPPVIIPYYNPYQMNPYQEYQHHWGDHPDHPH